MTYISSIDELIKCHGSVGCFICFIQVSDVDAVWALVSFGVLITIEDEVLPQIFSALTLCLLPSVFRVVLQITVSRIHLIHLLLDCHILHLDYCYIWITLIL